MSTLELENIKHPDNSGDNIALASNGSITIDRKSTDGTIAEFRKDGTAVGSIGATSGNSYIVNSTNGGIRLGNEYGRAVLEPCNESGIPEDNLHFIGSSTNRWRDLYLSGGVYLGGTGAVNKLDDYEEGTWTPGLSGGGGDASMASGTVGFYTKVGNLVHVTGTILIAGNGSNANNTTKITGLPFAVNGNGGARQVGAIGAWTGCTDSEKITLVADPSNTFIYVIRKLGTTYSHHNTFSATGNLYGISLVYQTA
jgi:hypothetical protein